MKAELLIEENKLIEAKNILDKIKPIVEKVDSDNWTQDYNATLALYDIKNDPSNTNIAIIKNALPILKDNEQYEKADLFYSVLKNHAIQNNNYKNA